MRLSEQSLVGVDFHPEFTEEEIIKDRRNRDWLALNLE